MPHGLQWSFREKCAILHQITVTQFIIRYLNTERRQLVSVDQFEYTESTESFPKSSKQKVIAGTK